MFTIPSYKTIVSEKKGGSNLDVIRNFNLPSQNTSYLSGFVDDSSLYRLNQFGVEEKLPTNVEEAYRNWERIQMRPSGKDNKLYNQDQIVEIAKNLGILTSENSNSGKTVLVPLIQNFIIDKIGIDPEDIIIPKKQPSVYFGRGRGRGKGRGK